MGKTERREDITKVLGHVGLGLANRATRKSVIADGPNILYLVKANLQVEKQLSANEQLKVVEGPSTVQQQQPLKGSSRGKRRARGQGLDSLKRGVHAGVKRLAGTHTEDHAATADAKRGKRSVSRGIDVLPNETMEARCQPHRSS